MWWVPNARRPGGAAGRRRPRRCWGRPRSRTPTPAQHLAPWTTTWPARPARRNASTSNSRRVRSTFFRCRDHTRRPTVSTRTVPTVSGSRIAPPPRRAAPARAMSTGKRERLVRKSSAPCRAPRPRSVAVLRRQHQDRRPVLPRREIGAQHVACAGQHDVEHDEVVAALRRHPPAVVAVGGQSTVNPSPLQPALHGGSVLWSSSTDEQLHVVPPTPTVHSRTLTDAEDEQSGSRQVGRRTMEAHETNDHDHRYLRAGCPAGRRRPSPTPSPKVATDDDGTPALDHRRRLDRAAPPPRAATGGGR